jgi:hypothetical protein
MSAAASHAPIIAIGEARYEELSVNADPSGLATIDKSCITPKRLNCEGGGGFFIVPMVFACDLRAAPVWGAHFGERAE